MKIAVAQTRPVKGEIEMNVSRHKKLIALAVEQGANVVVFPELSITGYEPELAKELAISADDPDPRFDDFQLISNGSRITIGIGAPVQGDDGILIGMVIFEPNKPRQVYYKRYLHADELPYFVCGAEQVFLAVRIRIRSPFLFHIMELSVPEHAEVGAFAEGRKIYLSSVAKSVAGAAKGYQRR